MYKDLPHPPSSYVALPNNHNNVVRKNLPYAYRTANGSDYNVLTPTLGMAGTPYARSVPNTRPLPTAFLPDAGLVFDTLLKRDEFVPHPSRSCYVFGWRCVADKSIPGGVSSLFFAFADLVIHSIFNTNGQDPSINNASSYLDLSPLYGSSEKEVDTVRRE